MQEYVTRAVVLDKEARGAHADARYSFFTERYGKIMARAKSSRKIVSKLAGHLEPGTLSAVRIIEQHGTQVVDALTTARLAVSIADLAALGSLLPEWQPEADLWRELLRWNDGVEVASAIRPRLPWSRVLAILGWDPHGAVCVQCNLPNRPARHFYVPRQEFFCAECAARFAGASRFGRSELLLVDD